MVYIFILALFSFSAGAAENFVPLENSSSIPPKFIYNKIIAELKEKDRNISEFNFKQILRLHLEFVKINPDHLASRALLDLQATYDNSDTCGCGFSQFLFLKYGKNKGFYDRLINYLDLGEDDESESCFCCLCCPLIHVIQCTIGCCLPCGYKGGFCCTTNAKNKISITQEEKYEILSNLKDFYKQSLHTKSSYEAIQETN